MTLGLRRPEEFLAMVDMRNGTVDRRIFSDQRIYELELEQIFVRAWNFLAHDTMLPNPGDFFLTFIGEDRIIVVRDKDGGVQALVNSCRHRGNAVCRAEEGHATSFMCTYHGWTFDLKGNLVGVPGFKEVYHEDLKREEWGLIKAAKVDSYKGFIFATMDPEAPDLAEYLGDVGRIGIDLLVAHGDTEMVPGIQKWTIDCNWKYAVDNVWDYYHAAITHGSAGMAGWVNGRLPRVPRPAQARRGNAYLVVPGEYGHVIGGPAVTEEMMAPGSTIDYSWRQTPAVKDLLGPVGVRVAGHPNIFPNMWIMPNYNQVSMRLPKGPRKTEIWWFSFYDGQQPDQAGRAAGVRRQLQHNGPNGMFETDDGENWSQSTSGTVGKVSMHYPLNYAMNVGRGEIVKDETGPPHIDTTNNEHAQLWFYKSWTEWMAADSWSQLKSRNVIPEENL